MVGLGVVVTRFICLPSTDSGSRVGTRRSGHDARVSVCVSVCVWWSGVGGPPGPLSTEGRGLDYGCSVRDGVVPWVVGGEERRLLCLPFSLCPTVSGSLGGRVRGIDSPTHRDEGCVSYGTRRRVGTLRGDPGTGGETGPVQSPPVSLDGPGGWTVRARRGPRSRDGTSNLFGQPTERMDRGRTGGRQDGLRLAVEGGPGQDWPSFTLPHLLQDVTPRDRTDP